MFGTDNGTAIPLANELDIFGAVAPADSDPVFTSASGNVVTVNVQTTQEIAASDATKIGLAAFDSSAFNVDANGFVTLAGGGGATTDIDVDTFTPPGTDPVVPNAGNIKMTGAQVASGVVGANVLRTDSLAANTVTYEIQQSGIAPAQNTALNGVAHFNSSEFTISNGFVSLLGGGEAIDSVAVQTGTSPIVPTAAGLVTINGALVASGVNPVRSHGTGANTLAIEVQTSQALASADATKVGLSNFSSASFAVDANGFVTLTGSGGAAIQTITGNSGGAEVPSAGNFNILGTGSITVAGSANTETVQLTGLTNHAIQIGAGTATLTQLAATATTGQILQNNASADPSYSTATYPSTTTVSQILYSSATNVVSGLTTANSATLVTNSTGVPVMSGTMTNGQVILGSTGATPVAASLTSSDSSITFTTGAGTLSLQVAGGTTVGKTITGDSGGALSPTAGNWNIVGSTAVAGTTPVVTSGSVSTLTVKVQRAQALASADSTKIGLANFSSADFAVDSNGFVTLAGTGGAAIQTITGNSGGAEVPSSGNFNILGTGSITVAGSANTETVQLTGLTNHAIQIGAGTATLTQLGAGTTGQVLQTNTTADPTWSTATYPSTTTINQVLYSSANNTVSGITAANNGTMISGTTGVPSWLANGTTGQVLTATTGSPPSWGTAPFLQVTSQTITATGAFTYTPTAGMKYVIVELVGGGAGGGGTATAAGGQCVVGGGGGSGAYSKFILTAAQVGASKTGVVGAGGGGGSGGASGTNGNDTTLATTSAWTAGGGVGGATSGAGTTATAAGGAAGALTTGTGTLIVASTSSGASGAATALYAISGYGGSNPIGQGGAPSVRVVANANNGNNGGNYGAGGSGAASLGVAGATGTGGSGANGIAIFTEYL